MNSPPGAGAPFEDDGLAALFERALALPRNRRRSFVDEACGEDATLRAELRSLLASHDSSPDFLETLGPRVLPPVFEALAAEVDPIGEVVGHYEILGRLGQGGMGEVFRARDLDLGRDVALKFLPTHLTEDDEARERLRHEARVASALDHPHIAVVHEIGTTRTAAFGEVARTFIAMAYCGDRTLADELRHVGTLSVGRALECSIQLVDALSSTHEAGIAHLDVKPANLIVTGHGDLKLVDFGLAARTGDTQALAQGRGTVAYMSPEQLSGGPVDHRADIWAAGVVLYEMLAGHPPFRGARVEPVALAICRESPTPLGAVCPGVPPRLAEVVHRCLARDPTARYSSSTALLTELRTLADTLDQGAEEASIVVLPFEDEGAAADGDGLGPGFAEEITADLSRVRALRVIARSSSRRLSAAGGDSSRVARGLGVRHALTGRIEVRADSLRVTASLLDTRTGARTRTLTIEGDRDELFQMRCEVVRATVASLGLTPAPDRTNAPNLPVEDPRAYEAYLRARHEAWSFSPDGLRRARRHLRSALDIVGDNELLYGALGHVAALHADSGLGQSPDVLLEVEELAGRVHALNPRSAKAHWLTTWAAFHRGDLRTAIRAGEHAHALEPDNSDVLLLLGYVYLHAERNGDGRALLERALLLDPLTPLTQGVQGLAPILEGRPADAVEPYRLASEMEPESPFFPTFHGWALAYARRIDEATATLHGVADRFPESVFASYARSLAHALDGRRAEALQAITPDFEAAAGGSEMFARELAHCHALAGSPEEALRWLERAVELGMWNHAFLAEHDWFLESVREDPRFAELLARVRAAQAAG